MTLQRRQFLKYLSTLAGMQLTAPFIGQSLAFAQNSEPHFFLLLRVNGAWDVLSGMDGKDLSLIKDIKENDLLLSNGRKVLSNINGNSVGNCFSPLMPYMSDVAIINGVMMIHNNSVHEVNRAYMSSGTTMNDEGFGLFQLASEIDNTQSMRIGYRLEREQINTGGYLNTIPLSSLENISIDNNELNELLAIDPAKEKLNIKMGLQTELTLQQMKEKKIIENLNLVKSKIGTTLGVDNIGLLKDLSFAISGLASGYINSAVCDIYQDLSLDSHQDHDSRHTPALTDCFGRVATVIKTLKETMYIGPNSDSKKSLFDLTTVMVMSEFSRTSAPENGNGTGHNPINNSCLLFGKNIKGGQTIGQSDIYNSNEINGDTTVLHANLFDFKNRNVLKKSEMINFLKENNGIVEKCNSRACVDYIYPEVIWGTIAKAFGVSKLPQVKTNNILTQLIKA